MGLRFISDLLGALGLELWQALCCSGRFGAQKRDDFRYSYADCCLVGVVVIVPGVPTGIDETETKNESLK